MIKLRQYIIQSSKTQFYRRAASTGCIHLENNKELTPALKHEIERHWRDKLGSNRFDATLQDRQKYYVLSMFPYPSGNLHMGHVRVYTISDAMARFYRMNGKNVLHPMGWDAFGLPAENAAIQRNIPATTWTTDNIAKMREQLENLGCSFDWTRELATCNPNYYKWTQSLFLKLFENGMAYQKEALVNWDPVDKTVLADEQVDANGCSWRSGAKVEKKLLKQWFIKTTKFAKQLLDGLDDPSLVDWKDIISLQRHWIGECNGYSFDLNVNFANEADASLRQVEVWTATPEDLYGAASFVVIKKEHILNKTNEIEGLLEGVSVLNPFTKQLLPIIVANDLEYPSSCNICLGVPGANDAHKLLADKYQVKYTLDRIDESKRQAILDQANSLNIGGYLVSSKLKDWLISRQRHWGTPIPIVHCPDCGPVPVEANNLPCLLPESGQKYAKTLCPKCNNPNSTRESDTMDTFVDSSWYFLRYLDTSCDYEMFNVDLAQRLMPVDLYIGGKEHAVLHLYYARFVNHFLHSLGLVPQPEPFKRLLVQGMVMGRSYRIKGSGQYLLESKVEIVNAKKNQAKVAETGEAVVMQWEKMSKSKLNGTDPLEVIDEQSCDTVRLIILGDVAPTSHRNWSTETFPGILNWQRRLWLAIDKFIELRRSAEIDQSVVESDEFKAFDAKLWNDRNYYVKGTTFNYKFSHQLSVAISKMQGLTNSIRKSPKEIIKFSPNYERTLGTLLTMMAPMAPHFASELWCHFCAAPNRLNYTTSDESPQQINWDLDVLQQRWPTVDRTYELDLCFKVNGLDLAVAKYTNEQLEKVTAEHALEVALQAAAVRDYVSDRRIVRTNYVLYSGCEGILNIFLEKLEGSTPEKSMKSDKIKAKKKQ